MSQRSPRRVEGVFAALVTPRLGDSTEADAGRLLDYMGALEQAGINGFVLFGSTGEFVHFDMAERVRVASLALRRSRVPILVNVSHSDLAGVAALAENAIGMGADGVLVMPPYFYSYDAANIEAFYRTVIDLFRTQIPVYLYNLPQHTNAIPVDLALRLLDSEAVAGIKDSSGDWNSFEQFAALKRNRNFAVLIGNERIYRCARRNGADGTVSGLAAAIPELMLAFDRALTRNDEQRACLLEQRILEYLEWVDKFPATVLIRQTAAVRGWVDAAQAVPLSEGQAVEMERFRRWFPDWHATALAHTR